MTIYIYRLFQYFLSFWSDYVFILVLTTLYKLWNVLEVTCKMKTLANCKIFSVVCVQFSLLICFFHVALPDFTIQGRSKKMFGIKRAVNIGVLMPMSRAVDVGLFCTERLSFITHIHQAQVRQYDCFTVPS